MPIRFIPVPDPYPETKPATEFIGGQLVQKMSPRGLHAGVQIAIGASLWTWARERACGRVGTEWDFDITPPGEQTNRLVPDVAYLSFDRVSREDEEAAQIPKLAPNVAVEVLSPGQSMGELAKKARIFLAAGCELVVVINPREKYAVLHDATGARRIGQEERLAHPALPGFDALLSTFFMS